MESTDDIKARIAKNKSIALARLKEKKADDICFVEVINHEEFSVKGKSITFQYPARRGMYIRLITFKYSLTY